MKKYYLLYRTTNQLNGRYYIGKHETTNLKDEYLGSGAILKKAVLKYGKAVFKREDLLFLENSKELNNAEVLAISKSINDPLCYNIAPGGQGGNVTFHFSQEEKMKIYEKISKSHKQNGVRPPGYDGTGTTVSNETKKKISDTKSGIKQTAEHRANISSAM